LVFFSGRRLRIFQVVVYERLPSRNKSREMHTSKHGSATSDNVSYVRFNIRFSLDFPRVLVSSTRSSCRISTFHGPAPVSRTLSRPSHYCVTFFTRPSILPVAPRNPTAKSFPNLRNPTSMTISRKGWTLRKGQNIRFAVEFPTSPASWTPCPCPPQSQTL